jgi:hypothetical protein
LLPGVIETFVLFGTFLIRVGKKKSNEGFYALYCSPNIILVIKSRRLRWAGHVARMGERRGACRVLVGKPDGRNHLEDRGVDGRIILKLILLGIWGFGLD